MAIITKLTRYDDGFKSQAWYYFKRISKHAISLIVAAVVTYMIGDNRFIAILPLLEVAQKVAKEKGFWY